CCLRSTVRAPRPPGSTLFPYTTLFRSCTRSPAGAASTTRRAPHQSVRRPHCADPAARERRDRDNWNRLRAAAWALQDFQQKENRSEEHTSELQSRENLVCRLLLEKNNT